MSLIKFEEAKEKWPAVREQMLELYNDLKEDGLDELSDKIRNAIKVMEEVFSE